MTTLLNIVILAFLLAGSTGPAVPADVSPRAASADWRQLPVVPRMDGPVRKAFLDDLQDSKAAGMRPGVFAKVGDSNTEMSPALYGLGCRKAGLDGRRFLGETIRRFSRQRVPNPRALSGCLAHNSFSRRSAAAQSATFSSWPVTRIAEMPATGIGSAPPGCAATATPVSCEIQAIRPRFVIVMTGTNDLALDQAQGVPIGDRTEIHIVQIVRQIRKRGSVPVVSTIPPIVNSPDGEAGTYAINAAIARAAVRTRTPLMNLWRALADPGMRNRGISEDGLHLSVFPNQLAPEIEAGPSTFSDSVDFTAPALRFGANRRNLIWVRTLSALDRTTSAGSG